MNRRDFINSLGAFSIAGMVGIDERVGTPQVAVTMDDPAIVETPKLKAEDRNRAILDALAKHSNLKAALFVCGKRIDSEAGKSLLSAWDREGHIIANHS